MRPNIQHESPPAKHIIKADVPCNAAFLHDVNRTVHQAESMRVRYG